MTWLVHTCDVIRLYVWHDSFICVITRMTCDDVWRDSFIRMTWLIHGAALSFMLMNESCHTYERMAAAWWLIYEHEWGCCQLFVAAAWCFVTHVKTSFHAYGYESCYIYEWVMSIVMSMSHVNESCQWVMSMSHVNESCQWVMSMSPVNESCQRVMSMSHVNESCQWVLSMSHVNESCQRVMSMSHVNESCQWVMSMSHVNESCQWVMSTSHVDLVTHVNESCHTYEHVMSRIWSRHNVASHVWVRHVSHMNTSRHTYARDLSHTWMSHVTHMNESCHTYEWVMSHVWMSRDSPQIGVICGWWQWTGDIHCLWLMAVNRSGWWQWIGDIQIGDIAGVTWWQCLASGDETLNRRHWWQWIGAYSLPAYRPPRQDPCLIRGWWQCHQPQMSWHDSIIYTWHDVFIRVTWLIGICKTTHSYVWHDVFME